MGLRPRSAAAGTGTRVPVATEERTPDGGINNCALANYEPESSCQICARIGACPDREKYGDRAGLMRGGGIAAVILPGNFVMETAEQHAGEQAFAAAAGDDEGRSVEVTWGEELFQPEQYNTFRVGPFRATTVVRKGETIATAVARLHGEISIVAVKIRAEKIANYLSALRAVQGVK